MRNVELIISRSEQELKNHNRKTLKVSEMQDIYRLSQTKENGGVDLFNLICNAFFFGYGVGSKRGVKYAKTEEDR